MTLLFHTKVKVDCFTQDCKMNMNNKVVIKISLNELLNRRMVRHMDRQSQASCSATEKNEIEKMTVLKVVFKRSILLTTYRRMVSIVSEGLRLRSSFVQCVTVIQLCRWRSERGRWLI